MRKIGLVDGVGESGICFKNMNENRGNKINKALRVKADIVLSTLLLGPGRLMAN